ncbi:TonB-dependent receptor [Mucilaginibacter sp. RT5R15]|nr:TonB-dependent receptor [Mucilaginibacter flavidus]
MKFYLHDKKCHDPVFLYRKYLRIMKIILLLIIATSLQVNATVYAQKITLSEKNAPLEKVLKKIRKQSGYTFFYESALLKHTHAITIDVKDGELKPLLDQILNNQSLTYSFAGKIIVIKSAVQPQLVIPPPEQPKPPINIKGTVVDDKGKFLPGASVKVKGTNLGVITNAQGEFEIKNVPDDAILMVSFVGYVTREISVKEDIGVIKLVAAPSVLTEIVVVGYGTQKKENLTGAVGVIKSESLSDRPTTSPANLLQGLAAGMTVTTQGNYPGASANIKIRETSTWQGGSDPLYVIDGFVRNAATFSQINPADIDNISILKDAASTAIYGVRGGNGVILVTTKHGVANQTYISYNGSYTRNTREITPRRMNAFDAYTFANQVFEQKGLPATDPSYYTPDELTYFKTHSYDWLKDTWRNPWNTSHNLAVSGGTNTTKYYVSAGYIKQEGATSNSFNKYNLSAKLDGQISNRISFNLNILTEWDNGDRPFWAYDYGDFNLSNIYNRLLMVTPGRPSFINGLPVGNFDNTNTANLAKGNGGYTRPTNNNISPSFQLKYQIPGIEGLSAKGTFAYNTTNSYTKAWRNAPSIYYFQTAGTNNHIVTDKLDFNRSGGYKILDQAQISGIGAPTELQESYGQSSNYQLDLMLNYERSFGLHNISAFAGYEQSAFRGHYSTIWDDNYSNPDYQQINGGSSQSTDWYIRGDENQPTGFASYLGRVDYNYASKYMIGFTFRADGSYVFPSNKRWGYFPAVSAAWNISKESFFANYARYVDFLKLRFSFGITGTDNTAPWQWQQTYNFNSSSGVYLGSSLPISTTLGSTINPNITWEKNKNYNLGLDFGILKKLLSGSVDVWYKKTSDILGQRNASVPSTVGASLPAVNYGIASAKGVELSLSHENHVGDFFYRVAANWAVSSNQYLKYDQAASVRDYQNVIGKPINGVIYGYVSEGIIRTQADVNNILQTHGANFTIFGNKPQPGMLMYQDIRGALGADGPDGKIDGNDQQRISLNGTPRINYGFNLTFGWHGVNVTGIFSGLAKYQIMPTDVYYRRPLPGNDNLTIWKNAWTPQTAATATMPSAIMNDWQGTDNSQESSTFWLKNGAFLRLKSLIVDYNLPSKWLKNSTVKAVKFYFSGENLYEWNHTKDWDPELGGDFRTYPILKGFTFGLNATF